LESKGRSNENGRPADGSYRVPSGEYRIIRAYFPPCTARQSQWRQAYQGRLQAGMKIVPARKMQARWLPEALALPDTGLSPRCIGLALLPSKSSLLLCALMEAAMTAFMQRASCWRPFGKNGGLPVAQNSIDVQ